MPRLARPPWWLAVFAVALSARLGFLFGVGEPVAYPNYFHAALAILQSPDPLGFVLKSDEWRSWGTAGSGGWTLAPLYYLFCAGVLAVFGPHLLPLQLVQCVLEALTAVGVGRLGRAVAGPGGVWAGIAYAVHWHAIAFHAGADTECLHTVLLVWSLVLLAEGASATPWTTAAGGFLLGVSALARAVSAGFLPLAGAWQVATLGLRRGGLRAGLTLAAGALAILPWTVRNLLLLGELVPIETVSIYNLWNDNAFVEDGRWGRQARLIDRQPSVSGKQAAALGFAALGWRRDPAAGVAKVRDGLEYFLRPSEAHTGLVLEHPYPAWRHVTGVGLGDVPFAIALALAAGFAVVRPRTPAGWLLLSWLGYYTFLLVVVFHTQVRYRTPFTPVLFACAAGGAALLAGGEPAARRRARVGALAGVVVVGWASWPYLAGAGRVALSELRLRAARQALEQGEDSRADQLVLVAAAADPGSARPFVAYAGWLERAGRPAVAAAACARAQSVKPFAWAPRILLPRLLADAGRSDEAALALAEAHRLSHDNPWLALEAAWRELPAPEADEVRLGENDYGAVRGFLEAGQGHRWSRGRAWLRLRPTVSAARYQATLEMGSPEPSPLAAPVVRARVSGEPWSRFTLDRSLRSFQVGGAAAPGGVLVVELEAPTWNRRGLPLEQGVRVDRLVVGRAP